MTDGASEADIEVIEEVEALEATLLEGIRIRRGIEGSERPTDLELVMTPLTASDEERAFVSLTLKLSIPLGYPRERPSIVIAHPRGLGESGISSLEKGLAKKCRDNLGDPILYQLVEYTQEFLTESNVPACSCAVCLCDLKKEDSFIKTPCYHYFHSLCYGSYIQNEISNRKAEEEEKQEQTTRDLRCPVCREILVQDVLNYDFSHFLKSPPPVVQVPESFTLTEDLKELQNSMKNLFEKQKLNGAIID
ncbi:RNF25 [Lepeophtheirus salmonis]|uniref:RNF25 n=3 Tax=Lepeophtheirus salmonis TaxID=72036 RepID=A0A7R8CKD0_LEPSM|nr:RNF25 [Lepeophtheirus salmonis]CAF2847013.1 RNF25 [Lepeophtheirus salmonis]